MDWVLDHLQFIIAVAGVVAYWLNQRRREKAGEEADYDGDGIPENRPVRKQLDPNEVDPAEAERARRIQEEIRRKILERRTGSVPTAEPPPLHLPNKDQSRPSRTGPTELPRPAVGGPLAETLRRMIEQVSDPEAEARAAAAERAVREHQRQLQEQLDTLDEQRRVESEKAALLLKTEAAVAREGIAANARRERARLFEGLRDAKSLRQSIVIREVLGTPVGLR